MKQPEDVYTLDLVPPDPHEYRAQHASMVLDVMIETRVAAAHKALRKGLESWRKSLAQRARRQRERRLRGMGRWEVRRYSQRMLNAFCHELAFGNNVERDYAPGEVTE